MPIWIATSNRTAVDWDTDLDGGVAQVDLFHIQRPADDSYELVFLFARAGQSVSGQRVAWAQSVESDDPVPAVFTPPSVGGGGSSGGSGPDPAGAADGDVWTADGVGGAGWEPVLAAAIPTFTAGHAAGIGTLRWYNDTGSSITIAGARATLSADAVDAATVVDVNVDGATALDAPISIAAGSRTAKVTDEIVVPADSYLTVDVDSVGTPGAGETLSVQFYT